MTNYNLGRVVGKGIASVTKTTSGREDTYTITYNDGSTYSFTVNNPAVVDVVEADNENAVSSDATYNAIATVTESIPTVVDTVENGNSNAVTSNAVYDYLPTVVDTVEDGNQHPVTSNATHDAIQTVSNSIPTVVDTVADGNQNAVTSNATYDAIQTVSNSIPTVVDVVQDGNNNPVSSNATYDAISTVSGNIPTVVDTVADGNMGAVTSNAVYDAIQNAVVSGIIDTVYPVGSIYMSVNTTSPATLFGGTWQKIEDTFLLASGSTYTSGATGGEATHTLTESEMPEHTHKVYTKRGNYTQSSSGNTIVTVHSSQGDETTGNAYNVKTGGSSAHNNMPPYLVVNVWKRTA